MKQLFTFGLLALLISCNSKQKEIEKLEGESIKIKWRIDDYSKVLKGFEDRRKIFTSKGYTPDTVGDWLEAKLKFQVDSLRLKQDSIEKRLKQLQKK